jgi:hypothetical protein
MLDSFASSSKIKRAIIDNHQHVQPHKNYGCGSHGSLSPSTTSPRVVALRSTASRQGSETLPATG